MGNNGWNFVRIMTPASTEKVDFSNKKAESPKNTPTGRITRKNEKEQEIIKKKQ
jgi:hypothetical protein